jgi:AAA domain-containing protein/UvrD-like helicase family protein
MNQLSLPLDRKYTLNEGQQTAHDWLVPFCLGDNMNGFEKVLLNGHAGTGKTFVINRVVEEVRRINKNINFGMTAPTHKAVRVLKKHSELADMLDFGTIHSFLALKQVLVQQKDGTYKVEYKPDWLPNGKRRKIDGINVLILDETSMLPDELFGYIEDEQRSRGLRVIYMGDSLQIPPVGKKQVTGEGSAIPFIPARQSSHRIYVLSLTEPQRQAKESPIIMYAEAIRDQFNRQKIAYDFTEDQKPHLELFAPKGKIAEMRAIFRSYFCTPEFEADPDYAKVISWTNKTTDYFNREIRLLINNVDNLPRIIEGEKLIMDEPLIDQDKRILLHNNDEVIAKNIKIGEVKVKYKLYPTNAMEVNKLLLDTGTDYTSHILNIKSYRCILVDELNREYPVDIIHEDDEAEFEILKKKLLQAAINNKDQFQKKTLWSQYYKITEHFAWVNYNYAITGHKSQGSTYDYCISMEWDIENNPDIEERNSIRYVAATRARNKLYVVK